MVVKKTLRLPTLSDTMDTNDMVSLFAMTYNLNNQTVSESDLGFLAMDSDIVFLSFQEVGPFVPVVCLRNQSLLSTIIADMYRRTHTVICDESLLGIKLVVLARSEVSKSIRINRVDTVSTGADGIYGNKGCVYASMIVKGTPFLFVAAHLPEGESEVDARNSSVSVIMREIQISLKRNPILAHSFICFAGDLNYRVNMDYDSAIVADIDELVLHDQLKEEQNQLKVLQGFHENPIEFMPTYKYDINTNVFDTSKKRRVPSYTDRILLYAKSRKTFTQSSYKANHSIWISDHRPVMATYEFVLYKNDEDEFVKAPSASICCNVF